MKILKVNKEIQNIYGLCFHEFIRAIQLIIVRRPDYAIMKQTQSKCKDFVNRPTFFFNSLYFKSQLAIKGIDKEILKL